MVYTPVHVDSKGVEVVEPLQGNLSVGAGPAVVIVVDGDAWSSHDAGGDVMHHCSLVRVGHVSDVDLPAADLALTLWEVRHHVDTCLELHVLAVYHHPCTHQTASEMNKHTAYKYWKKESVTKSKNNSTSECINCIPLQQIDTPPPPSLTYWRDSITSLHSQNRAAAREAQHLCMLCRCACGTPGTSSAHQKCQ